jgi:PKD repeat protein
MSVRTLGSGLFSCLLVAGLFGACVNAEDPGDGTGSPSENVATQALTDLPPTAAFSVVCIDKTCFADAEASSDDVFIANYHWDWGDGAITSGGSSAEAPSHTYAGYTPIDIILTVTDSIGQTSVASKTLQLIQPPTAAFNFTCSSRVCHVDASISSGPAVISSYHWDWDDETTTDTTSATTSHTYAFGATFHVHLTVTDNRGISAGITQSLVVL